MLCLGQGRKVLFSGTPCQCDGLLHYLGKPYDGLITVDIICNSVPSPRVFREYMDGIEARFRDRIDRVDMRDKTLGWGTMDSYRYHFRSGREVLNPKGIPGWQYVYESGLISRESCFGCRYTNLGRVTDFTIGDFWDIRNLRPELKSASGTSVLLVNSEKAEALTDRIAEFADLWEVAEDAYLQPRLEEPTPAPAAYDEFWSAYFAKGCRKTLDRYFPGKSLPRRIAGKLVKMLSH